MLSEGNSIQGGTELKRNKALLWFGALGYPAIGLVLHLFSNLGQFLLGYVAIPIVSFLGLMLISRKMVRPQASATFLVLVLLSENIHSAFNMILRNRLSGLAPGTYMGGVIITLMLMPRRWGVFASLLLINLMCIVLVYLYSNLQTQEAQSFLVQLLILSGAAAWFRLDYLKLMNALDGATQMHHQIQASLPDGVAILRGDFGVQYANPAFSRLLELRSVNQIEVKTAVLNLSPESDSPNHAHPWLKALEGETVIDQDLSVAAGGKRKYFRLSIAPFIWMDADTQAQSNCFLLTLSDITELREASEQVQTQQAIVQNSARFSALGELAANIGHEINNPLSTIHLYVEKLGAQEGADTQALTTMSRAVHRIIDIVASLKGVARSPDMEEQVSVDLNDAYRECAVFLGEKLRIADVRLESKLKPGDQVIGRPGQVLQVLLNLVQNAAESVQDQSERWVRIVPLDMEGWIGIAVENSGPPIPPHVRENILKPFFTSKPRGRGTGLGLTLSRKIMESFGGELVLSTQLIPTRFEMRFPKRDQVKRVA